MLSSRVFSPMRLNFRQRPRCTRETPRSCKFTVSPRYSAGLLRPERFPFPCISSKRWPARKAARFRISVNEPISSLSFAWRERGGQETSRDGRAPGPLLARSANQDPLPHAGFCPATSVVSRAKGYNLSWRASGGIFSAALPRLTLRMMALADFVQTKGVGSALLCLI